MATATRDEIVSPMLTDLYQLSMAHAYWKAGKHRQPAVFDLFFRSSPFKGEFTVFCGLQDCLQLLDRFRFRERDVQFLRQSQPEWEEEFFEYLMNLDARDVKVSAIAEGSVVFPRVPLMRIEGPLAVCQLLETTFLVLVNFSSLIATNAARHRLAAGADKSLVEFGLRRAQGPDGAMSASKYAYIGGFDATSNVAAAMTYGIPCSGTHAHAFVSSFVSLQDLHYSTIKSPEGEDVEFVGRVLENLAVICPSKRTNEGELAAFISYAQSNPSRFLALVDTYDVMNSGIPNFLAVAVALSKIGYKPLGIRLDSGDLAEQSKQSRAEFFRISELFHVDLRNLNIVASNDIHEAVLRSLNDKGHSIDTFGIGTHLVTCKAQPALGCVYKLVSIDGHPRIKLSQEISKVTIPGKKKAYRLYNQEGFPFVDLMMFDSESPPLSGEKFLCRHPFDSKKRYLVTPSRVEPLYQIYWDGNYVETLSSIEDIKQRCSSQISSLPEKHTRFPDPVPYLVTLSDELFQFMHNLWEKECPIPEFF